MRKLFLILIITTWVFSGCSLLNPYESEFKCKDADTGTCKSLMSAYNDAKGESVEKTVSDTESIVTPYFKQTYAYKKNPLSFLAKARSKMLVYSWDRHVEERKLPKEDPKQMYEKDKFETLSKLLSKTNKPLVAPPKVLKVLIYPYSSGDRSEVLNMQRFVFLKVEDSKWIFDPKEIR